MARIRKLNMTNVDSFTRCSEGVHTAKIVEIQENTTQAGDDMLTMVFEVIRGDSKGAKVYDNFVLTDKALWKLKQLLQSLGVKCNGKIALDLDKLIGKVCDIAVYHEEYNGKLKARIDEYTPVKSSGESDDEDYDDEGEDDTEEEKSAKKKPTAKKTKKQPEPEPEEDDDDEDWDDEEEEEKPQPKKPKKSTKAPAKKSKKQPEPEDDWDEDDDDEDWEET
jgi:hypothetical protein